MNDISFLRLCCKNLTCALFGLVYARAVRDEQILNRILRRGSHTVDFRGSSSFKAP